MKTINYAGGVVLTPDAVADALVDYAAALAQSDGSAELTIPVILEDGSRSVATLLLGPASQLVAQPAVGAVGEFEDDELVTDIVRKIAALGPHQAQPAAPPPVSGLDEFGLE